MFSLRAYHQFSLYRGLSGFLVEKHGLMKPDLSLKCRGTRRALLRRKKGRLERMIMKKGKKRRNKLTDLGKLDLIVTAIDICA